MSRQSIAPRNLTLTEELEKLEQSITLTLQEIDHNFSRAHRIVTTNILPIVENYGKHSEAVWEGSKFWKGFFEASANVSLSGYEAPDGDVDESATHEETRESHLYDDEVEDTVTGATATPPRRRPSHAEEFDDTSTLDSPSLAHAHSTPRALHTQEEPPSFADYPSPYESLKREVHTGTRTTGSWTPGAAPSTPGKAQDLPDMSMYESSPFMPSARKYTASKDPVLHHMLDKTYRIAATPHTAQKTKTIAGFTPGTARRSAADMKWEIDSSPPSSPAPQLRAELFSSPMKAPRTPGVSILQTPAKGRQAFNNPTTTTQSRGVFDSDSDSDDMGFSPPKTMHFHIPQSRLLQTPAREASRRIVEDLLLTAGGDITESTGALDDDSPSVVRPRIDLDDSF